MASKPSADHNEESTTLVDPEPETAEKSEPLLKLELSGTSVPPVRLSQILETQETPNAPESQETPDIPESQETDISQSLATADIPESLETPEMPESLESLERRLFSACVTGDLDAVTLAMTSGADLKSTDATGNTVIHMLAARGHHLILSEVLKHTKTLAGDTQTNTADERTTNLNLELQNEDGLTPLMLACYHGNLETVKVLLTAGANPNTTSESQFSWLHRLALRGEDGMMTLALNNYADGNVTDKHGRTPLHYACGSGNGKVVTFLRTALNTNVDLDMQDKDGYSAVMYAVAQGDIKSTNILLDYECDVSLTAKNGQTAACFLDSVNDIRTKEIIAGKVLCRCEKPSENHKHKPRTLLTEIIATSGDQALHVTLASPNYNHEILQILTSHMSDLNIRNTFGHLPLCLASISIRTELIDLFSKTTLQEGINQPDSIGFTPVMYAAGYGTVDMISRLIDNGSDISHESYAKTQALHVACVLDKPTNLKCLIDCGAEISSATKHGWQALHLSVLFSPECFREIIKSLGNSSTVNAILPDGRTALHIACDYNKYHIVGMLLEAGASVNIADIRGETPLHRAVSPEGGSESVWLLLGKRAEVEAENTMGRTPLWVAAYYGQHGSLPILVEHGADINKADIERVSPLMAACLGNNAECVKFLIDERAETEQCDMFNRTELDIACTLGHQSLVEILLDSHSYKPQSIKEPMFEAAIRGYDKILAELINRGADKNIADDDGKTALYKSLEYKQNECARLLIDSGADKHQKTKTGRQALHMAAEKGMYKMLKLLLDKGADCNVLDKDSTSPLYLSACNGCSKSINMLLDHSNKKVVNTKSNNNGYSPLSIAVEKGKTDICEKLLKAEADPVAVTHELCSALHLAVGGNHIETLKLLMNRENKIDALNKYQETPLYVACSSNNVDIAELLIKDGAAVNFQKESCGTAAIHIAADNGHLQIIKLLIKNRADVDIKVNDERTALHIASYNGYIDIMEELINAGADIKKESKEGWSPLYLAATAGREEACQLLCKKLDKQPAQKNIHAHNGLTPLMIAAQGGNAQCCQILLDSGADIHCTDTNGNTALHFASIAKSSTSLVNPLKCVLLLLDRGIDMHQQGVDKKTALFIATECQNEDAALLLISRGANVRATDSCGNNILHIAAELNCIEVVGKVLEQEKNAVNVCSILKSECRSLVEYANQEGFTPLHYACKNGNGDIVALLLKYGATAPEGPESPIILAARNGYLDVVRQLIKHIKVSSTSIYLVRGLLKEGKVYSKLGLAFGFPKTTNKSVRAAQNIWQQIQKYNASCLERKKVSWVFFSGFQQEIGSFKDFIDAKMTDEAKNIETLSLELMKIIASEMQSRFSHKVTSTLSGSCKSGWKTGELDEFDFLVEIIVDDLKLLGDRDMKEWLYTYLLEILPDETEDHEGLTEEVKILGINRSRSAPCVNFTIGWKCSKAHNHEINFDITIAAGVNSTETRDKCNLDHLSFQPAFDNEWKKASEIPVIYVPVRENGYSTWAVSLIMVDTIIKEDITQSYPNIKDVMLILKFLRDLTFPRVLKYSPKRTSYKSNGKDGDLISSYIIQHLMYMELIKCPSNIEWAKSKLADRVLSILSTMEVGQYTDLYRKSTKFILNTPYSDKENLLWWLRKDIHIISSTLRQLSERYTHPTLPDVDNLTASIAENQDKVYIIAGDKLRKIGREELYYKPDIRESLGLSPYSNIYYYLPPTLDDYEKRRPITAKIVLKRYAVFKQCEL